jgi:hypothetical protein
MEWRKQNMSDGWAGSEALERQTDDGRLDAIKVVKVVVLCTSHYTS